jgi:hypothetical protein
MKRAASLAVALAVCLLSGCATKYWYRSGVSAEQSQRDLAEAQAEGVKFGYVSHDAGFGMGSAIGTGIGDGIETAARRNEIISACMRAKGYQLLSKSELDAVGGTPAK